MVGTGYAATQLPKSSVGSKQLKKNAVTSAKVKDHSLTGKDISLSTLGTVPSATQAGTAAAADMAKVATVANGLAPLEPTHLIGASGQPPFENGATNALGESGVEFPHAGFYKNMTGLSTSPGWSTPANCTARCSPFPRDTGPPPAP